MKNTHPGFVHRALHRVLNYKRSVMYWQQQERKHLAQSRLQQEREISLNPCEGFLSGYETFVEQTLKSYTDDITPYADAVEIASLLQRCVSLMRQELAAEANRLCDEFRKHIVNEAEFRSTLRQRADAAVEKLAETLRCPQMLAA